MDMDMDMDIDMDMDMDMQHENEHEYELCMSVEHVEVEVRISEMSDFWDLQTCAWLPRRKKLRLLACLCEVLKSGILKIPKKFQIPEDLRESDTFFRISKYHL
jgi:hypothetical protein